MRFYPRFITSNTCTHFSTHPIFQNTRRCGAYVPFDSSLFTFPDSKFKIQKFYSGASLGLPAEYGNLPKSRSLAISGASKLNGPFIIYVSTKGAASQSVYALVDLKGRGQADYALKIASFGPVLPNATAGAPNGIAWYGGALYVLASSYWDANRLFKIPNVDTFALNNTQVPYSSIQLVRDDLPFDAWHGWRYIRFDASGNLFIAIGANCNDCNIFGNGTDNGSMYSKAYDSNMTIVHNSFQKCPTCGKFQFASIYRFTAPYNGTVYPSMVQVAAGVRNTVGFDFVGSNLYFTDNGRDDIGGSNATDPNVMNVTRNSPDCEFNMVSVPTSFPKTNYSAPRYGFPYCHTGAAGPNPDNAYLQPYLRNAGIGNDIVDPDNNAGQVNLACNGVAYKRALQAFGPHIAPLGVRFYKKDPNNNDKTNFPLSYSGTALVAQHGSWDRDFAIGARVMQVVLNSSTSVSQYNYFLAGGVPCDTGLVAGPTCSTAGSANKNIQSWVSRPVDIELLPDTTILVSDDEMGAVYRVVYCDNTKAGWGGNAPYGVGRCGGKPHLPTADKLTVSTMVPATISITSGCQVNVGGTNKAYLRCLQFDSTQRGSYTNFAYNLLPGVNGSLIMDAAFVAQDYKEVNGDGWVGYGATPNGQGNPMPGTQALFLSPLSGGTGAGLGVYTMGAGASGVAGFSAPNPNFFAAGSTQQYGSAGGALYVSFKFNLPKRINATGPPQNMTNLIAFGDKNAATGGYGQHWVINIFNLLVNPADVNVPTPTGTPVINPPLPTEPTYTPSCPYSPLTSATCAGAGCLNGVNYDSYTTLNTWTGLSLTVYTSYDSVNNRLNVGLQADASSYGANGYAVFCIPKTDVMSGNDCVFLRKYTSAGNTELVNYVLDGYNGYQPSLPANCTYSGISALQASPLNAMVGQFSIPYTGKLKFRFGGASAPGTAGIDGMTKHPAGTPPFFGCIGLSGTAPVVTGYTSAQINSLSAAGWSTTLCA